MFSFFKVTKVIRGRGGYKKFNSYVEKALNPACRFLKVNSLLFYSLDVNVSGEET